MRSFVRHEFFILISLNILKEIVKLSFKVLNSIILQPIRDERTICLKGPLNVKHEVLDSADPVNFPPVTIAV